LSRCPICAAENRDAARFCDSCGASLAAKQEQRRKPATLLFCDVSGSTAMSERLDAEAVRELMLRYFHQMRSAIERHGGTVEKFVGDAVMAVFGVPTAHEDDPLRACRAACEMRERLDELNRELEPRYGSRLAVRIGVNTGEVVADDASARETFVTGDAVNTAARLEQAAAKGEILIGASTYNLVRDDVSAEQVEPIAAKGKAEPVAAYRLVSADRAGPRRLRETPLVGRERELSQLRELFEEAQRSRRCILATILGEPGAGKSRLTEEFLRSIGSGPITVAGRCLPYGEAITYWPLGEIVRAAARIHHEHNRLQAVERIVDLMRREEDGETVAALLSRALGLAEGTASSLEIAWAARRLAETLAREQPLVLVVDDLQWAEQPLVDLVATIAQGAQAPILVLCLARPEFADARADWEVTVRLSPLDAADAAALASSVLEGRVAPSVVARVVAAAGGNALFLEELAAAIRDDVLDGEIPSTIEALLAARLDGLPDDERAVAETASIEGQTFHRGAVVALSRPAVRSEVPTVLGRLGVRDLVLEAPSSFVDDAAFRFRHLLIRDAAYLSTLKRTRVDLHERFGGWLVEQVADRLPEFEEIVGYHLEQAFRYRGELGPPDAAARAIGARAGGHLAAAGHRAIGRGDVGAALNLLERAVALVPADERDVGIDLELAWLLGLAGRPGDAEAVAAAAASTAAALGNRPGELRARIDGTHMAFSGDMARGDELLALIEEALPVFEAANDHAGLVTAWHARNQLDYQQGRFAAGVEAAERVLHHARLAGDEGKQRFAMSALAFGQFYGPTPVDRALAWLDEHRSVEPHFLNLVFARAGLLSMIGRFDEARALAQSAAARQEEFGFVLGIAAGSPQWMWFVETHAGDPAAAERLARDSCTRLGELGERVFRATSAGQLAQSLATLGRYDEALEWAGVTRELAADDDNVAQIAWRQVTAKVLARRGAHSEAVGLARETVEFTTRTDMVCWNAEALVDAAEAFALAGHAEESDRHLADALRLFEAKGNTVMAETTRARIATIGATA
jgi:class 3 adenylate cyclase/tetratricopeptide (TPR) repeat protein